MLAKKIIALFIIAICAQQVSCKLKKEGMIYRFLDKFLLNIVHRLFNQPPANQNGTFAAYEKYAYNDQTNEDIATGNSQQLIVRSGYKYENHYVLSGDGYITQLVRIINPLADRRQLKQPPVMLFHGGIINPTAYIFASSIQHHPERYPQLPGDSHTSWNRSLGFMLANHGYDVWLVGIRGSSSQNQGHIKYKVFQSRGFLLKDEDSIKKDRITQDFEDLRDSFHYWDYSYDDIGNHEMPAQVNKVLEVTGARNVTMFTFSCSTHVALAALSTNAALAAKVHNLVMMAPILNYKGVNRFMDAMRRIFMTVDYKWGTFLFSGMLTAQPFRDLILLIGKSRDLRYTVVKAFINYLTGSSAKFFTNLEGPVIGHVFEPTSFKMLQHMFQQVTAEKIQRYDFGHDMNVYKYGSPEPPVIDISDLGVRDWALVTAENDNMAPSGSSQQLLDSVRIKPNAIINYPQANHLDLVAGFENDKFVNLPLLNWFERHCMEPLRSKVRITAEYLEKQAELEALVPGVTGEESVNTIDS